MCHGASPTPVALRTQCTTLCEQGSVAARREEITEEPVPPA